MHRNAPGGLIRLSLTFAMALSAGGEVAADEPRPAAAGLSSPPCPTVADIETAIGHPVEAHAVPMDGCMYQVTGRHRGAVITLMYQPATRAADVFAEIRDHVKVKGAGATPDRLSLGEGGWGYTSKSRQEAAVVSQGRLYHVKIGAAFFQSVTFPGNAALRVIELGMRAAPGGQTASAGAAADPDAATFDACTLASNAEVAQVVEEKPELLKFWSAPRTSYGGSHCDYGEGSLRVYAGKSAAADFESTLARFGLAKEPRVPVEGMGHKAFFMILYPEDENKRAGLLAVYPGARVLMLTLGPNGDELVAATRPRLERFAKLVLPRLP